MCCHGRFDLRVTLAVLAHVVRRHTCFDLPLVQEIIDDSDVADVVCSSGLHALLFERRLWEKVVVVLAVGPLKPVVIDVHDGIVVEGPRLLVRQKAKHGLCKAATRAEEALLVDHLRGDIHRKSRVEIRFFAFSNFPGMLNILPELALDRGSVSAGQRSPPEELTEAAGLLWGWLVWMAVKEGWQRG